MPTRILHCQDCARQYPAPEAPSAHLHCRACGGPLGATAPAEKPQEEKDPYKKQEISDVQLRKLAERRPDCYVYHGIFRKLGTNLRVEIFPEPLEGEREAWVHERMRRAALTREIRSPRVAALTDLGRTKDYYYIISEDQPKNLRAELDKSGRLKPRKVLSLADDVLRGLRAVDRVANRHGDVTPEGILLGHDDAARLRHLGVQRHPDLAGRFTVSPGGGLCGRALYEAPETGAEDEGFQVPGDVRSDIYSLGATMFEMLTGRPPFPGEDPHAVRAEHLHSPVPELSSVGPELPSDLSDLVHRFMARDPADRPQTPDDALEELRECAVELSRRQRIRPVQAAMTTAQRLTRQLTWGGLWGLAALGLVAASVIPLAMLIRGCREREQAEIVAAEDERHRTLVVVTPGRGAVPELPAEEAYAIQTMLSLALDQQPHVEPWDRSWSMDDQGEDVPVEQILRETEAPYVLVARHNPGLGRRRWLVAYMRRREPQWTAVSETAVEENSPDGLAALETALHQVLQKASVRMPDTPGFDTPRAVPAPVPAWAAMGRALQKERLGDWDAALSEVAKAREAAPQATAFAVLEAFYAACRALEQGEPVPELNLPAGPDGASQWGLLAQALAAAGGAPDEVETTLGRVIARYPFSVRGYYLMGLWRWKRLQEDGAAVLPLDKALAFDEAYEPARRALAAVEHARPADTREVDPSGGTGPLKVLREAAERMEEKKQKKQDGE